VQHRWGVFEELLNNNNRRERRVCDDANPKVFKRRITRYKLQKIREEAELDHLPFDKVLDGGLKMPGDIWSKLYK